MQLSRTLPPLLALAGTFLGASSSASLHDAAASVGGPLPLPGAVIRAQDPAAARLAALSAGAGEVWMALPAGDPRLAGAQPDPRTLAAGPDGRVRYDGARRLPLPEGLGGLLHLDAEQLGPGTPRSLLADRAVVVVFDDPAVGQRVASPGRAAPVDRGEVLAVALATKRADAHLFVLPLGVAAALVGATAFGWQRVLRRLSDRRGLVATAVVAVLAVVVGVGARRLGVELPWLGLVGAVGLALGERLLVTYRDALLTLDRIVFRLGAPPGAGDGRRRADRAEVLAAARDPRVRNAELLAERVRARAERWERLLDQCGLPVGAFGPDGGLTYASPALVARVHGATALSDVLTALAGDDAPRALSRLLEGGADGPFLLPTPSGDDTLVLCPVGARGGTLLQLVPGGAATGGDDLVLEAEADDAASEDTPRDRVAAAFAATGALGADDPTTESVDLPVDRAPVRRSDVDGDAGAPASS